MKVYGPVPSRRLGKSLGINNIPHKVCSYTCLYCQVGKAVKLQVDRQVFYQPEELVCVVGDILNKIDNEKLYPDYISIVPDGEPTLDINLGKLIDQLKVFKIPIAVITNGSIIDRPDVQKDLRKAGYISIKADTAVPETWKKINIPHKSLDFQNVSSGIRAFVKGFNGKLVTETMLIKNINDSTSEIEATAKYISNFKPHTAYISIPTRPTAFSNIAPPDEKTILEAYHIFKKYISHVELLTGYEGNSFSASGDSEDDLLSITAVHPMREEAVYELLRKNGDSEQLLMSLLDDKLKKVYYNDTNYYVRRFQGD